jgi:hypothetical protein
MMIEVQDRGSSLRVVRATRDAEAERPRLETVGNIPKGRLEMPSQLRAKLSEIELAEVEAHLKGLRDLVELGDKLAAHDLAATVARAARYLRTVRDEEERFRLQAIFGEAAVQLRRARSAKPR